MERHTDLDSWATFLAVTDEGSFTAAAQALGVSVPTVSKTVAALEEHLGLTLFHRTSRRLSLSAAGEAALAEARVHVTGLAALAEELRDRDGPPRGLIRMSAPVSFSIAHLSGPLTAFLCDWPEVELDLHLADETVDLVGGGYDLAVRIGRLPDSSLRARKLCDIRMPLLAAPDYLERRGAPERPEDLSAHETIAYSQTAEPLRWTLRHDLQGERTVTISPRLTVDNGDVGLAALRAGLGIAIQPEFFVYDDLKSGRLVELLLPWAAPPVGAYVVTPPSRLQPRRVRLLVEALVAAMRAMPWSYQAA